MAWSCSTGRNAPHTPADKPVKQTGRLMKLSGNFNVSIKYFKTPGTLPLYSGVTTCRPDAWRMASANGAKDFGFSAYELGEKISGGSWARSETCSGTLS